MPDEMTVQSETTPGSSPERKSRGWVYVPLAIFLGVAGMFGIALNSGDPSKLPSALIGRPVPAVDFAALEGLSRPQGPVPGFSAAELSKGDVTIVNFWASWCAPCVAEHPLLVELAENSGVKLYGVNYKDKPEAARRFLGRYGNPFAAMGVDPKGRGAIEWGVYGMPETFVINGRGEIAYKHVGPITHQSMRDNLLPALKAAAATGSVAAE